MEESAALSGRSVLIIDDSATVTALLKGLLEASGVAVEGAATGAEAFAALGRTERFDMILLDLSLPDVDGLDILRDLREDDQDTAVVVITGSAGVRSATDAFALGADGYVDKRFLSTSDGMAELRHTLASALERRSGVVAQRQLDDLKRQLFSMVTHDLRGPASRIAMSLQYMLGDDEDPLSANQRQLAEIGLRGSEGIIRLVTDFLTYSKIEQGYLDPNPESLDLNAVIEHGLAPHRFHATSRSRTLEHTVPDKPVEVVADRGHVLQITDNLLTNAIKYTEAGGTVRVSVSEDGDFATLTVSDDGPGMPPGQLKDLFAPFQDKSDEGRRAIQGTGLGLQIVHAMVTAHGGTIAVESEVGQGSTFVVRLPKAGPPERAL